MGDRNDAPTEAAAAALDGRDDRPGSAIGFEDTRQTDLFKRGAVFPLAAKRRRAPAMACAARTDPKIVADKYISRNGGQGASNGGDAEPPASDIDRVAEIERLAALDTIEYEAARKGAAERLGFRPSALDKEVKKKQRTLGLDQDNDKNGQGRAIRIDDVAPWDDPVDGDMLASSIAAAVNVYAIMSDEAADAIALWVIDSWVVNEFPIAPRLAITSPTKGCGKTTVLRLLNVLARRAKRAGSISSAALFRLIEMMQPTILLDETEKYIEHGSEMHALLNEGHAKGGKVIRVIGDNHDLCEFNVFGAVAYCRNGRLPDDLEQRSIVVEMQRRRPDEELAELRDDRCEPLQRLARMCARWAEDHAHHFAGSEPDMGGLINRTADNWRPLFAIADVIGADWPARVREAARALAPREVDSNETLLLADIKAIFGEKGTDRLGSEEICEALAAIEGRPWAEYGKARKPISKNQLAGLLGRFSIRPDSVRIGARTPKGYRLHQFTEAFERYLTPQGVREPQHRNKADEMGTSEQFRTATAETVLRSENGQKPPSDGLCCGVADRKGGGDPSAAVDAYEERAAALEYDAGLPRAEAEATARREVAAAWPELPDCLRRTDP